MPSFRRCSEERRRGAAPSAVRGVVPHNTTAASSSFSTRLPGATTDPRLSSNPHTRQKAVRFALDEDDNLVNERIQLSVRRKLDLSDDPHPSSVNMEPVMYATVRNGNSPVKEHHQQASSNLRVPPQVPLNIQPRTTEHQGFRPYQAQFRPANRHFRQNTELWIHEGGYKVCQNSHFFTIPPFHVFFS